MSPPPDIYQRLKLAIDRVNLKNPASEEEARYLGPPFMERCRSWLDWRDKVRQENNNG